MLSELVNGSLANGDSYNFLADSWEVNFVNLEAASFHLGEFNPELAWKFSHGLALGCSLVT